MLRTMRRSVVLFAVTLAVAITTGWGDETFNGLMQAGKYQEAIKYAETNLPPSSRTVDIWLNLAVASEKSGLAKEQVLANFQEAKKANPSDPRVMTALGSYYLSIKNYADALKEFQSSYLLKRSGAIAEKMAVCAAALGKWDKAKDAAESAVELDSTVEECRPILAKLYIEEKNWPGAVEQLEFLVKKNPSNLEQLKQFAECSQKAGLTAKLPAADSLIVLADKNNIPSRQRFAEHCLAKKHDTAEAARLYKELAILTPTDAKPFKFLYQYSRAKGASDEATLYLKNYLVLDSSSADLHWQLGDLLYDKKDLNGALESYRRGFRRAPQTHGHFKQFADILLQKKLDDEAVAVINAAIAAKEANVDLYSAAGTINQKRGQWANAIKMFQEVLKSDPKNLPALSALAECQAKSGDYKNAVIAYEQIVLMNPQAGAEYKLLGDLHTKLGKKDNAIEAYRKYLVFIGKDDTLAKKIGLYAYEAKQWQDAIKYLNMVAAPGLHDGDYLTALGMSRYQTGDYKGAAEALAKVNAAKPPAKVLLPILIPLADCYERNGNDAQAGTIYETYTRLSGGKDQEVAYKAASLQEKSDKAGAIKVYLENIKTYPKDYRNFLRLGLYYASDSANLTKASDMLTAASILMDTSRMLWRTLAVVEGKLRSEAKEFKAWTKLVALEPADVDGNRRLGILQAERKQYAAAIPHLEVAAIAAPQDADLQLLLANCYLETKKPADAIVLLRKAKVLRPDDPKIRVSIIDAAAKVGGSENADKEKAELADIDKKVIAKDKKNIESRIRLIEYYYTQKDFTNAYPLLKELAALTPKDAIVFRKLYEIATKNGDKKEAADYLRKYVALDPANANAFRNLGDLLYEQKEADGALAAYRTTVKLNPKLKGFYQNYIELVLQKKLEVEAIGVIQNAIALSEATLGNYLSLGDIFKKKDRFADAVKMYQEALKLDPKNVEAMTALGECQVAAGDVKNAIITYEQIVLMKPKAGKEYKILGDLQAKAGKPANAIDDYQKYLADNPSDQAVSKTVGLYKFNQKQFKDAIPYLEAVKDGSQQNVDYFVALGECYNQTGQTTKTIEALSKVWAAKPAPAILMPALKTLASCYDKTGDQSKVLEVYDAYTKLPNVHDQDASFQCGYLREKSDKATAIKVYSSNTMAFPKDYRNFLRLGLLLSADSLSAERSAMALRAASQLVDSIPMLWETLAKDYGRLHNDDGELLALQKLLGFQPQNLEANKRASALLLKKKQIAPAITNLEMVLTMSPRDVASMLLLAEGYLETKRPAQALDLLTKAKGIEQNNIAIRTKLYELEKQTSQDQKAETEIKELIDLTKDNKYRLLYAQDLIAKQRYPEATKLLAEAKASDPMNIEALMLRGSIQKAQKLYEEAIETYKEISYINENYAPALAARAEAYLLTNKPDRAEQYYAKALKADPNCALAELGMALLAKAQKNNAGYTEHLNKAKALDPKNPQIQQEAAKAGGTR
jgi:tetratricopeptide (TPR) repeat protein